MKPFDYTPRSLGKDLIYITVHVHRYGEELKKARNEGIKKGLSTSVVLGTFYLVIFGGFALGFW